MEMKTDFSKILPTENMKVHCTFYFCIQNDGYESENSTKQTSNNT